MSTRRKITQKKTIPANPIESLLKKIQSKLKNYCNFWRENIEALR